MSDPKYAYSIITGGAGLPAGGKRLVETVHSIPEGERLLVIDNSATGWTLAKAWNYSIQKLCVEEGFDAVICCNDDVVLRPDTGILLTEALLWRQFSEERDHKERELLLITAYNTRDLPDLGPRWGTGPDYSCWCANNKLIQVIGPFDENFPVYFEDNDSHYRIRGCGFEAMSYAPYFHHGSSTTNMSTQHQEIVARKFDQSKDYYIRKWGGPPASEVYRNAFGPR